MSVDIEPAVPRPRVKLIDSDGEPLETDWHVLQIQLLRDLVSYHFRGRDDFYAGGNMFIYYCVKQARQRKSKFRGPDFFYVDGVPRLPIRRYWCVWEEGGRYPDLIVELLSPTTATVDRTTKKILYERTFKTHEYVCYDPETRTLESWRLGAHQRYRPIKPDARGWLWLEELGAWLGIWQGEYVGFELVWLRLFDRDGRLIPTRAEAEKARADAEKTQAEAEKARAEAEKARAEVETARAEAEKLRADEAEAELQRLQQRLAALEGRSPKRRNGR